MRIFAYAVALVVTLVLNEGNARITNCTMSLLLGAGLDYSREYDLGFIRDVERFIHSFEKHQNVD